MKVKDFVEQHKQEECYIKVYHLKVKRLAYKNVGNKISLGKELVEAKGKFSLWKKEQDMQEQNL